MALSEAASLMFLNSASIMVCVHEFKVLGLWMANVRMRRCQLDNYLFMVNVVTPFLAVSKTSSSFALMFRAMWL